MACFWFLAVSFVRFLILLHAEAIKGKHTPVFDRKVPLQKTNQAVLRKNLVCGKQNPPTGAVLVFKSYF